MDDTPSRTRYRIDLTTWRPPSRADASPSEAAVRPIVAEDADALAAVMLDAYRGTIDDEGESLEDANDEIAVWFGDTPMLDHSWGIEVNGALASAVLVMTVDNLPFIAFVMTAADHKGAGLAKAVVEASLSGLALAGHPSVEFVITNGNTPSERLFIGAGATPVPPVPSVPPGQPRATR